MSEPMFDADDILNFQAEGEMSTEYTPVPEGEWPGYIKNYAVKTGISNKDPENPRPWALLNVGWAITDPEVKRLMERDEDADDPIAYQTVFLDIDENGRMKMGKGNNVPLGKLRDAVGQNGPGAWAIPMLEGCHGLCRVEHRQLEDGRVVGNVTAVAAA